MLKYFSNVLKLTNSNEVIKKEDILKSLNDTTVNIEELAKETKMLKTINVKRLPSEKVDAAYSLLSKGGFTGDVSASLKKLDYIVKDVRSGVSELILTISGLPNDHILAKTMSPKEAAALDLGYVITNIVPVLTALMHGVVYRLSGSESVYSAKDKDIDGVVSRGRITIQGILKKPLYKRVKELDELSTDIASTDKDSLTMSDNRFVGIMHDFEGNPIYHIRRWWLNREFEQYKRDEYEHKLLSIKLMELKEQERGSEPPANVAAQIKYYEEQVRLKEAEIEDFRR